MIVFNNNNWVLKGYIDENFIWRINNEYRVIIGYYNIVNKNNFSKRSKGK